MTKLFLQSGKLMIGEFPEAPFSYCGCEMCERHKQERSDESVESAKASAVEVVNGEDCFHKINDWLTPLPGGGLGRQLQKGELCDLPKGWTVGYEYQFYSTMEAKWIYSAYQDNTQKNASRRRIARLISSENPRGEVGIVATGIPEAEHSEGFEWLIKTNELITDASQTLFEDGGVTEEGICLITPHGNIALTVSELRRIIEEVSPPPQAERGHTMNDIFDWLDSVGHYNSLVTSKDFKGIRLADIIYDFVTRKKP